MTEKKNKEKFLTGAFKKGQPPAGWLTVRKEEGMGNSLRRGKRTKRLFWACTAALALCCCAVPLIRAARSTKELADTIIRLHIVAASDDEADQADKLLVRDGIAELARLELSDCQSKQEAQQTIAARLGRIEQKASEILKEQGRPSNVTVRLTQEHFPLRQYGKLTVPAGTYTALVVTIGEGEGHNWWCVMYPPLCYSGTDLQNEQEAIDFLDARLSPQTMERVLQGEETVYRFALLDGLKAFLSGEGERGEGETEKS